MPRQWRTAIIGAGGIARSHAQAVAEQGERLALVAAVDVDPGRLEAFRATYGVPNGYQDAAAMLERERPDLVQICTPPGLHARLSIQAMEAGAWVLCEKPLCASLAELDQIADAERRTGRSCASVFQWRFGAGGQHLRRLIREGALGRPLVAVCNTTWYRGADYYAVPWRGKWATELGGPTMGHGIHAMDFLLYLLGDWEEVRAMLGTLDRAIEVEDVSMALVRFASGAMASIVNSVLSPREESYLRFDFQRATVELTHLYRYRNEHWRYSPLPGASDEERAALARLQAPADDTPPSHGTQLAAFLDAMDRGERPLTSGPEARRTIEFLTSLYKAAVTGQPVRRGSIRPGDPFYAQIAGTAAQPAGATGG
jgi:predicted dehydrogenase